MDKKISQKDKVNEIILEFRREVSFSESIKDFARFSDLKLEDDGSINIEEDNEKYLAMSKQLNDHIEIGYFNIKPGKDLQIIRKSSNRYDTIAMTFNFGAFYEQKINDEEYVVAEGVVNSLIVNNYGIKTTTRIRKGNGLHALVIRYNEEFLRSAFGEAGNFVKNVLNVDGPVVLFADLNAPIVNAIRSLELYKIPESTTIPYLIGKSYVLAALVIDLLEKRSSSQKLNLKSTEYQNLLTVRKYITSDWKKPPTIPMVSKYLGMSPTKAKALFKQFYGITIYAYFSKKRMEEAMKMIEKGELSIAEIGHSLGYRNLGHFAESFKKHYGILPKKLSKVKKHYYSI